MTGWGYPPNWTGADADDSNGFIPTLRGEAAKDGAPEQQWSGRIGVLWWATRPHLFLTVTANRLGSKWSDLIRHLSLLLLMMFASEEVGRSLLRPVVLPLTSEVTNMTALLIVLLIVLLLGGGRWGYSGWRG